MFPIDDKRTAFLLADVSGKGLGAAIVTTMLQGALSAMTLGTDPAVVFNHVNRFLCDHSEVGRYATMFFGILDGSEAGVHQRGASFADFDARGWVEEAFTEGSFPGGTGAGSGVHHSETATGTERYAGAVQRRRDGSDGSG